MLDPDTTALPEQPPHDPPLVLIVEDDRLTRLQLRRFLEKEHYRVVEANNGEEGLNSYIRHHPDLILLDALMPVMDGFQCCAQLCQLPDGKHAGILMITALEDQQSVDRAFEAGAIDYITKPINWAVLRQRVKRLIQQSQLYQQLETINRQLTAANQMLQHLVLIDGLTKIANRRCFDLSLDREWRRMSREKQPLSLILCDIDFFKGFNDTYGHQAGDTCLYQVAMAISQATKRAADLVARYGGEEFVVVLPSTDLDGAMRVAKDIQDNIHGLKISHASSQVSSHVTLSLGVSSIWPRPQSCPSLLVQAADQALYQAKLQGRDRIFSIGL